MIIQWFEGRCIYRRPFSDRESCFREQTAPAGVREGRTIAVTYDRHQKYSKLPFSHIPSASRRSARHLQGMYAL